MCTIFYLKKVHYNKCFAFIYSFAHLGLCWVFIPVQAFLQLQRAGATLQLWWESFSLWQLLLLQSTVSRAHGLQQLQCVDSVFLVPRLQSTGSADVADRFSCSKAHEIFPDQGSNLCFLHWQVESLPLNHQGSPKVILLFGQ